ncbi:P-loop ATPase, Sll1717 family [Paenibacillus contaminans]|uniref:FunZ protein n=1 Tax=Paenibacillus contaminans TaxID=450362 RepID=A0A329ML74_9BACL|nr:funZ protein [Paenibacillus contaminans]RAV19463.1 funZ protein [Paenibacillus contaminans]
MRKRVSELDFGSGDAINYKQRNNKEFFNKIFLTDHKLRAILKPDKYFLIGEKGTGKTAYSTFLANNDYDNNISDNIFISETEYKRFLNLLIKHNLLTSDIIQIWKVILLKLLSDGVRRCLDYSNPFKGVLNYKKLADAIDEYGEITSSVLGVSGAIDLVDNASLSITVFQKYFPIQTPNQIVSKNYMFELLYLKSQFEKCLSAVKVKNSYILFIDGIDIKPEGITQEEYIECIKGLLNASWEINTGFLGNIRGLQNYQIKVVVLLRPDIFDVMGLHNQNNKLRDNSVMLDWRTTYNDYVSSGLYKIAMKMLISQQDFSVEDEEKLFEQYFPYKIWNHKKQAQIDSPFIDFLRHSFYRPRDIVVLFDIMKDYIELNNPDATEFPNDTFRKCLESYSEYLLGEVKDQLKFYYTDDEYQVFLNFFHYLDGNKEFDYDQLCEAYDKYLDFLNVNGIACPQFYQTVDIFLQFIYELNIICYVEVFESRDDELLRWCFRERSYSNLKPKVRLKSTYRIHYGLQKALNVGRKIKTNS